MSRACKLGPITTDERFAAREVHVFAAELCETFEYTASFRRSQLIGSRRGCTGLAVGAA